MENNNSYLDLETIKKISLEMPKAELHLHIEGTFEPEFIYELGIKEHVDKFSSIEDIRKNFQFDSLNHFLEYSDGFFVLLKTREDFRNLALNYFKKANQNGIIYAELTYGPMLFENNNVSHEELLSGYLEAMEIAHIEYKIESNLILTFDRSHSEEECIEIYKKSLKLYLDMGVREKIVAIGLVCKEIGNPPNKFPKLFEMAKKDGFNLTCHACEESFIPLEYIDQALNVLNVDRLDHGVHVYKDEKLLKQVRDNQIPLTVCPLSQVTLKVFDKIEEFPYQTLKSNKLLFSLNSDDPAWFGGYVGQDYISLAKCNNFTLDDFKLLARNSFNSSFLSKDKKEWYLSKVNDYFDNLKI